MRMILPVILMNSLPHTGVQAKEPNILIIQCDQLRAMSIGCYGNTQIRTPNIDSLAARGIRFDQAVTLTPFCAPTRASFQSGLYQHQHRVLGNNDKMADDVICFAEIFADASYVTGYSGKWHLDGDTSGHEDVIKKQFVANSESYFSFFSVIFFL